MKKKTAITQVVFFWWVSLIWAVAQGMQDIHGPKPLVELPPSEPGIAWWWWLVAAGGMAALCILFWWLRRPRGVVVTAAQRARQELNRLQEEGETLEAATFAEEVSGVLRQFIECRFGLAAPKRTTEEFLQEAAAGEHCLTGAAGNLRGFLSACDFAKFAGGALDGSQREDLLTKACEFVESASQGEKMESGVAV